MQRSETDQPALKSFSPWKLSQPEDGIAYIYRSSVDGFWYIINDEDFALEEATNYPVGELLEYEAMGDYEPSESGDMRAIFLPKPESGDGGGQA